MGTQAATLQRKPVIQSATRAPVATVMRSPSKHATTAVPAYLQKSRIQRAQKISQPHDPAEREAEATAKAVVSMNVPATASALGTGIQRASEGQTAVAPAIPQGISANLSGGMPLPPKVRAFMEPRFRANFGAVRIHTGEKAASLNRQLSARAFTTGNDIFFGQGEFQPESLAGMELLAHELTHTIQQGATVQASEAAPAITQAAPRKLQRLGISDVLDYFADKANNIPGYRMFTIILGFNPINMSDVDRSGANILRALIEFLPGGKLITDALEKYGVFTKAGAWIDTQFKKLGNIGSAIRNAISEFIDSLGWRDIFHLGRVWDRAKRIFTDPIDRIIDFGKGLVDGIITLIKDAILMPLAKLAEGTRGWDLLCAVLGKNPITGEKVPQTAEALVGGFMKFIGQEETWKRILATNALGKVWAWFKNALATLLDFVSQLPALAIAAFKSLTITDILVLPRAIIKIVNVFGNFAIRFVNWALDAVWNLLEIIFSVVSPGAWGYIKKTGAALKSILKNPLPFVSNLGKAAKGGFQAFSSRFLSVHLPGGLSDWLLGSLPGIYIPKAFSLPEIAKFALSALGLSWGNIRAKLVKVIGETAMKVLETGFDIVVTLVRDGPAAAWDKIKEQLSNLKEMVIGAITGLVVEYVVTRGIPKLVSMFIPGAGFITAIISIYEMIMVFVNKIATIIQVVTGFVDSIVAIAAGAIGTAVGKVESVLAGLVKLAINFLAGFAGLGKAADKIMGVLEKVRAPIDKALDWLVGWIVAAAKAAGKFLFGGKKDKPDSRTEDQKKRDKMSAIAEAERLLPEDGFDEQDVRGKLVSIEKSYNLLTLNLVVDSKKEQSETIHFTASASEEVAGKPKQVKIDAAGASKELAKGSWIKILSGNLFEQVTSGVTLKRRKASGDEILVEFATAKPEGGNSRRKYSDEGNTWERTAFLHGSSHVVPVGNGQFVLKTSARGSAFIRPTFYGDTRDSRSAIVQQKLPLLPNPSKPNEFLSDGDPAREIAMGYKIDVKTGRASVPIANASPDHDPPIAAHWNLHGNIAVQSTRETWNKALSTYKLMSLKLNLSLGSRGENYTEKVGIGFRGPGE